MLSALACQPGGQNVATAGESRPAPSIRIISPMPQEKIASDMVRIKVEVSHFVLDGAAVGAFAVPGRGHWHIYLDGDWVGTSADDTFVLDGLSPGPHQIKVSLANNDHSPLSPPAEDTVVVEVDSFSLGRPQQPYDQALDNDDIYIFPQGVRTAHFIGSTPAHGDIVHSSPIVVDIMFDFRLAQESEIEVLLDGSPVIVGPAVVSSDGYSLSAAIPGADVPGTYQVIYRACWPYLNCHEGSFAFVFDPRGPHGDVHHR